MKKNILFLSLLLILLGVVVWLEYNTPKKTDWKETFSKQDKNPFGCYVLHDMLPSIFSSAPITTSRQTIYEIQKQYQETPSLNYIFINESFNPSTYDSESLLSLVNEGNNVFIAAYDIWGKLADSLHIKTNSKYVGFLALDTTKRYTWNQLTNPTLENKKLYRSRIAYRVNYFESFDSTHTTVLGVDSMQRANFIRMKYGKGNFYFHAMPVLFTNYNLLYENEEYISKTLSYLPINKTIWDEYYKIGRSGPQTPMRFILSNDSLRWGYYTLLILVALIIFFQGKRRQKIIPILPPVSNTTLEFTETVGRLYFQYGDHKNLANKKINYLVDYIRTHLFISTIEYNDAFFERISQKSGIELEKIKILFQFILSIQKKDKISEKELHALNTAIENFYQKSKR